MSELLIVLAIIAVGKIHGQRADVSQVINFQPVPVPALERRPVLHREYSEFRTSRPPLRLYTNAPRPADRDYLKIPNGNDNFNLPPPTVRENQPKRKLYVSSKVPDKISRPLNYSVTMNNTIEQEQDSNDVYVDIIFGHNSNISGDTIYPVVTQNSVGVTSQNNNNVIPVNPNPTNVNKTIPVEVSLDERSSFSGDPCPAGYARVNGQCVKAD